MFSVNEIFKSIDGEGIRTGKPCIFVRFNGCNLRCNYCDTGYALKFGKSNYTLEELMTEVDKFNCKRITLTGGEPLIQPNIDQFIKCLYDDGYEINIETNGSVDVYNFHRELRKIINMRHSNPILYTVDYKCVGSGEASLYMCDENFSGKYLIGAEFCYKFVVSSKEDLTEARYIINKTNLLNNGECFLSPCFGRIEPKELVEFILRHKDMNDANVQVQLHKIIWNPNKRGV